MSPDQPFRLQAGGRVERDAPLHFQFDGRQLAGLQGDTLASALLANGVRLVGRSFKLHRPRGILSAGVEEPNALVEVGTGAHAEPNVRVTLQPLYEGLIATSQNRWPSLRFDIGALFDLTAGLWPAGFYNKTFMWPNWRWYEGAVRRAAGLGRLPEAADPDYYVHANAHCDVLICGSGPAGLAAALSAGRSGARVLLVELDRELGGSLLWRSAQVNEQPGAVWVEQAGATLSRDNVQVLTNTTVAGCFDHNVVLLAERLHRRHGERGPRERLWTVRTKQIIVATGAIEQPLSFPDNDRPGIMLASAVEQYALRYGVASGRQVVVATNNDGGHHSAMALSQAGMTVRAVIDLRTEVASELITSVRNRGIAVHSNAIPIATCGRRSLRALKYVLRNPAARNGHGEAATLPCDCLAMAGGWQPTVHLLSQNRGRLRFGADIGAFVPETVPAHMHVVGAANGVFGVTEALAEGFRAGLAAAEACGLRLNPSTGTCPQSALAPVSVRTERVSIRERPERQWVDFQHDVTLRDIEIAVRENYSSVEHLKRYTTTGMAVDQGKTSNLNALLGLAERMRRNPGEVGTTTFRPFYLPITLGTIAGRRQGKFYAPSRQSPLSAVAAASSALFWDYGAWRRPAAYPQHQESLADAIQREARTVRAAVGLFDASPLGKIEVRGRDAANFLNRIYVNNILSLKVGHARYGIMLNDNGVILDDGIVVRIAAEHFLLHPSSGNTDRVYGWLEQWSHSEWPDLEVLLTPVTSQWATVAVAGPNARKVLATLEHSSVADGPAGIRPSRSLIPPGGEFPHMRWRATALSGVPARILRASFTGELSFELSVPSDYGEALWQRLITAGESFGLAPFGVESLMVLRIEKGYLHVGSDTDGITTPDDLGWGEIAARKQADFLGKRSLRRPQNRRQDRLQFVGLEPLEPRQEMPVGAHVIGPQLRRAPAPTDGYVTSACFSPMLQRWIALGLVRRGRARIGETVNLFHAGEVTPARIVGPTFYDPDGVRLQS